MVSMPLRRWSRHARARVRACRRNAQVSRHEPGPERPPLRTPDQAARDSHTLRSVLLIYSGSITDGVPCACSCTFHQGIPPDISNPVRTMADDAAAHDADNGSVESDETVATVDERDLPSDGGAGGGGGNDTPSEGEEDEEHELDGSGGGPTFRVREVECGDSILVIMDISLPPAGRPGGKARLQSFLFLRQCEELLYGSTAGSYTGALHAAVKTGTHRARFDLQ